MPATNPSDQPFDGRVPPPDFAGIETTRFCNLRCRMCTQFNDGTTVSGPHMELPQFTRIANSLFPYVRRWQPTVSGEPTMSKDFAAMLTLAERYGVKAEMFSNGTLLNAAMIERLVANLGALSISFDGATAATFENIREGADFADVTQKIRNLVQHSRTHLPPDLQPLLGLNCTLMEQNIRELPDLVRLAKALGMDQLSCYHVFPVTAEMKRQSLVHHRELTRRCLDEACAVADELDLTLRVQALDQRTAATAFEPGTKTTFASRDGIVEGFECRSVHADRALPWPVFDHRHPDFAAVQARRLEALERSGFPVPYDRPPADNAPGEPIWYCDFLWHKTYVAVDGDVRPCCVFGVPVLANLLHEPFEQVWNNDAHRAMRQRMVRKQPVAACRGCMHIQEVTDPNEIARHLQGRRVPRADELPPLPSVLDPKHAKRQRRGEPPVLEWPAAANARSYVVQFSLDGFASILFSTDGPLGGPAIRENRYPVPPWAWREAPVDREIGYRVLAKLADGPVEILRGSAPAEPPA